ncbi:putative mediator of RNA polymerase II transcription subunit 17 [Eutrema salsugineum]|uniref:putative mediator of RNA polymerase II transcription subunit 17 n=1 Tax=Eutrema salsugineum TaxID=72664 RepID=UPI000CED2BD1|nr:putative mediator of RNA polymerase II transcription subunit 17 [Eutrema salsugineum]
MSSIMSKEISTFTSTNYGQASSRNSKHTTIYIIREVIIQGLDVVVEGGGEKNGTDGRLVGRDGMVVGNEGKVGITSGGIALGIVGRVGCGKVDGIANGGIAVLGIVGRVGSGNVDGNGGNPIFGIGTFGI